MDRRGRLVELQIRVYYLRNPDVACQDRNGEKTLAFEAATMTTENTAAREDSRKRGIAIRMLPGPSFVEGLLEGVIVAQLETSPVLMAVAAGLLMLWWAFRR